MSRAQKRRIAAIWTLTTLEAWIAECERLLECYQTGKAATHGNCGLCTIKDSVIWATDLVGGAPSGSCGGVCVWPYFTGYTCTDYANEYFKSKGINWGDVPQYNGPGWHLWVEKRKQQLPQWIRALKKVLKEKQNEAN